MKIKNIIQTVASSTALLACLSGSAQATSWDLNNVLFGTDGGFGASGFHYAGNAGSGSNADSNVMTGSAITSSDITGFNSGSYDDISGAFSITLDLVGGEDVTLNGNLLFSTPTTGGNLLSANSNLVANFSTAPILPTAETIGSLVNIGFKPGDLCCTGTYDPNGFYTGGALAPDLAVMSLWGATWDTSTSGAFGGTYDSPLLGMDLRLEFKDNTPGTGGDVPEPSSLVLIGLALVATSRMRSKAKA